MFSKLVFPTIPYNKRPHVAVSSCLDLRPRVIIHPERRILLPVPISHAQGRILQQVEGAENKTGEDSGILCFDY